MSGNRFGLVIVGVALVGWGLTARSAGAGATQIEVEGKLIAEPHGDGYRIGINTTEGKSWFWKPSSTARRSVRIAGHRLYRLRHTYAYVKVAGLLLSKIEKKIGAEEIKSGKMVVLTLEVSQDGKRATLGDRSVRVHPYSSLPTNAPLDEQPKKRQLLDPIKGKRIQLKGFGFHDRAGKITDVFLDIVQATVITPTPLLSRPDMKTGKRKVLQKLPGNARVWVRNVEGRYARVQYEVQTSDISSSIRGGWVPVSLLRFEVPKPKGDNGKLGVWNEVSKVGFVPRKKGASGKLIGLLD